MGFGARLKKWTTIPSKGTLGKLATPLRKVVGRNALDEIGAVGGFLVGGPAGAGIGAAAGDFIHNQNVGKAAGAGIKGLALASGASALGVPGGGSLSLPGLGGGGVGGYGSAAGKAQSLGDLGRLGQGTGIGARIAKAAGGAGRWLTDPQQGLARQQLLVNGLGAGASIYGAQQAGAAQDEEIQMSREEAERIRKIRESYAPQLNAIIARGGR